MAPRIRIGAADFLDSSLNYVTPDYFETMGMRLQSGRAFNWFDRGEGTPQKAIVNEAFVRHFFPGEKPDWANASDSLVRAGSQSRQ